MDFLQVSGRNILVMGVANKKSVAYHSAKVLADAGANVIFSVRSEQRRETVRRDHYVGRLGVAMNEAGAVRREVARRQVAWQTRHPPT